MENIWGCEETCPFCNAPCMNNVKDHIKINAKSKHYCFLHRRLSLLGIAYQDADGSLWNVDCSQINLIKRKHGPKQLKKYFPATEYETSKDPLLLSTADLHEDWYIGGVTDYKFWKWISFKYQEDIRKLYKQKLIVRPEWDYPIGDILDELKTVSYYK